MPEGIHLDLLRTNRELEQFIPQWRSLWREDGNATPFQSPEWLLPWWHQFGQPELRAVVIANCASPIAFLPGYIYPEPVSGERQLLLLGAGTSDYLDGIFSPRCKAEHIHAAFCLLEESGGWDTFHAVQLRAQSPLLQAARTAADFPVRFFPGENCSRMPALPMAQLPVKIRRNAMYYRNRASRRGRLQLVSADMQTWPLGFDALVRLHTERWQSCGEPGVLADSRVLNCHREAIPQLLQAGMLRLDWLTLDEEIIAAVVAFMDPSWASFQPSRMQSMYIYMLAHSIRHAEFRPGTVLLALASEKAAAEGFQQIDFLRGEEPYKNLWHVETVPTFGFAMAGSAKQRGLANGQPPRMWIQDCLACHRPRWVRSRSGIR